MEGKGDWHNEPAESREHYNPEPFFGHGDSCYKSCERGPLQVPHSQPQTVVRIVNSGPGYMVVEGDCGGPMADGRIFGTEGDAKAFAHGYGWVIDDRWNQDVIL